MRGMNIKEICRKIKLSGKGMLIWSRQDEYHYVTNRQWMIRFADDQLPREILVLLFSVFAKIPEPGRALVSQMSEVKEQEALDVTGIYKSMMESKLGKFTSFTKDADEKWAMRIIQFGSEFIYVSEDYARMVDLTEEPLCSSTLAPLFFLEGAVIILPYRNTAKNDDQALLTELVG